MALRLKVKNSVERHVLHHARDGFIINKIAEMKLQRIEHAVGHHVAPQAAPPAEEVEAANHLFDPNALILGFARRFATYKRPNLLLHDPQRLLRLLTDPQRPVQLIIAGKAHPAD